ncbi:MAG: hypothetical protein AB7O97_03570 [Planctomycetota bacterium]
MNAMRILPLVFGGLVVAVAAGAVWFAVSATGTLPDGPVDVIWDKAACAHCSMHMGEPAFAAQLTTTAGETMLFDDPGCLFLHVAAARPPVHAAWFHHMHEDRWIAAAAVAFAPTSPTPMGFGWGAVDADTAGAVGLEVARDRVLQGVNPPEAR